MVEEEEDDEEMYELASLPNGEISGVSSEAEGGEEEQKSEMSDSNEKDAAGSQSETTSDLKRALIEDIRFVLIMSPFTININMSGFCPAKYSFLKLWLIYSFSLRHSGRVSLVSV